MMLPWDPKGKQEKKGYGLIVTCFVKNWKGSIVLVIIIIFEHDRNEVTCLEAKNFFREMASIRMVCVEVYGCIFLSSH